MYFKSKRDLSYNVIIWIQVLILVFLPWMNLSALGDHLFIYLSISGIYLILLMWIWFGTKYFIKGDELIVRSGPFRKRIALSEIKKIELNTNNESLALVLSPALSFERVNILYGDRFDLISLSPRDQMSFIQELSLRNREIKFPLSADFSSGDR